jgi:hypothetical protein
MVQRQLVGLTAIILVATTLTTMLIFESGEEEAVRVVASRNPDKVAGSPGSPSYSLDFMAVRELPDLIIRLHFLSKIGNPVLDRPWNETTGRSPEDMCANYLTLGTIKTFLDDLSAQLGEPTYEVLEFNDTGLMVIDLTKTIVALGAEDQLTTLSTMYAFDPDSEGDITIYAGYRDFFVGRDRSITEIKYSTRSEATCFKSERVGGSGCLDIEDAPFGTIRLRDLPADEIASLEVNLDALHVSTRMDLLRIVRTATGYGPGPLLVDWLGAKGG